MNQNTKQKRSAASWLAELAKGRYGEYALSVLTALLGVACSLIPYFIIIRLITALVNGTAELPRCLTLCAWMAGCWVLRYVLHSVSTSLSHHATFHVLANTRVRLLDKLATLPLGTVLDRSSGSYKNIIVERVDSIETTLAHLLPEMTTNIVGALAVLVLLFIEDWRMGLSMFIVLPLGIFILSFFVLTNFGRLGSLYLSKNQNPLGRRCNRTRNQFKSFLFHLIGYIFDSCRHFLCFRRVFYNNRLIHSEASFVIFFGVCERKSFYGYAFLKKSSRIRSCSTGKVRGIQSVLEKAFF